MTAYLAVPVVPSWIAFLICLAVFSLFVAVACWIDGNKGRRVYNDLLDANQRATKQTRAEDDAIVGRERWSA